LLRETRIIDSVKKMMRSHTLYVPVKIPEPTCRACRCAKKIGRFQGENIYSLTGSVFLGKYQ